MNLPSIENKDYLDLAATVLTIFTSMCIEDDRSIFFDRLTKLASVNADPRHLQVTL